MTKSVQSVRMSYPCGGSDRGGSSGRTVKNWSSRVVARHLRFTSALRQAYVEAANKIGSETDRNRALAALAGSSQL